MSVDKMNSIICKNLSKVYTDGKNRKTALNNLSFTFEGNGILAIIGRNGAGKTTLVRILSTELMPTRGTAKINGFDVITEPEKIRELIAIVPQEARAIQWLTPKQTIISYLMYRGIGFSKASSMAESTLKQLSLEKQLNKLNRLLSGGTKRKVLVATVLSSGAKIIFLDEPTTGLDPISRSDLWTLLNKLKKEYLIILTTHYLEEAERLADKIGIIENGNLLAFDSINGLRKKLKYKYSIRIVDSMVKIKNKDAISIKGIDGNQQILTNERTSSEISKKLIKDGVRFSTNIVSLEDIFYYLVKKPINEEKEDNDEW